MQADLWKALLRRIPEEHADNLMLMTAQGTEINVQMILRMEEDVVILRGRLSGTSDAGRIFMVPYEHLDHIGFQRPMTDAQLQAALGITVTAATRPAPAAETAPPPAAPEAAPAAPAPPTLTPPPGSATGGAVPGLLARLPSKAEMIQRLRQRTEARDSASSSPKQ
jgi:hypothetical protein